MTDWDIPELDPHRLATVVPAHVYAGGSICDPATTLWIWRTASLKKATGTTVGFYVSDDRLEPLWRNPGRHTDLFLRHQIGALIEPDFSLWTDDAVIQQAFNVFRMRSLGRLWQESGLRIIPNLAWSDERSFAFCFTGIPEGAALVSCECRTPGGNDDDRRRFLAGLTEGVRRVQPQHVIVYGGTTHRYWLADRLPKGPHYHLIDSWTDARGKIRAAQERHAREKNQLNLFEGGTTKWADEVQPAAA